MGKKYVIEGLGEICPLCIQSQGRAGKGEAAARVPGRLRRRLHGSRLRAAPGRADQGDRRQPETGCEAGAEAQGGAEAERGARGGSPHAEVTVEQGWSVPQDGASLCGPLAWSTDPKGH